MKLTEGNLMDLVRNEYMSESKASTSERQERDFVAAVNKAVEENGGAISVVVRHKVVGGVVGAKKVDITPPSGKEPYIDVVLMTSSGNIGISMKGPSAPSMMGGGYVGIESMYPGWLRGLFTKAVDMIEAAGIKPGDSFTDVSKDLRNMGKTLVRRADEQAVHKKNPHKVDVVVFSGYPDGKEYDARMGEVPPYIGKGELIKTRSGNLTKWNYVSKIDDPSAARKVPDVYFKIADETVIRSLFVGNKYMGGPVDAVYVGPMEVGTRWDGAKATLEFVGAAMYDVEEYMEYNPDIYIRLRKRRVDQPFAPVQEDRDEHIVLGNWVVGRSVATGEGSAMRVVITTTKPSEDADGLYGGIA